MFTSNLAIVLAHDGVFTALALEPFPKITGTIGYQAAAHFDEAGSLALHGPPGKGLNCDRNVAREVCAADQSIVVLREGKQGKKHFGISLNVEVIPRMYPAFEKQTPYQKSG